ncbi:MAG: hypothetical protein AB1430_09200 [Pseudomonadota bacterium]
MAWWNIGIAAVGLVVNVAGQQKAKKAAKQDAAFEAEQRRKAAALSRATGQRHAIEERRQARLVESALQARAGGGGLDPTIVDLQSDIAGEGEYRALSALYEGNEGALGMEAAADSTLRGARARARAADYQTAGTILEFGSSLYGGLNTRYSGRGPAAKS